MEELPDDWKNDFESPDDAPCGAQGPAPGPGLLGYRCTRVAGHDGAHEVRTDGNRVDAWGP